MKIKINGGDDHQGYYIAIYVDRRKCFPQIIPGKKLVIDHNISEILNFSNIDEYQNLGVKYGGIITEGGLYFNNKEDINKFINSDEFISRVVITKLKI